MKTDKDVSQEQFLEFVAGQVRPWTEAEIGRLSAVVESVGRKLAPFRLPLPEKVLLIKTTGLEEGGAIYTRANAIVVPARMVAALGEGSLIHELFHVFTRHNAQVRDRLYAVLGFVPCGEVALPQSLRPIKITNPDAPHNAHRVALRVGGRTVQAVPVLLSRWPKYNPAAGGEFFSYLQLKLMVVENRQGKWAPTEQADGKAVLLDPDEVPDYLARIGRNTGYIIHPEEVLADNFVLLVNKAKDLPSPHIIQGIKRVLEAAATMPASTSASAPGPPPP
jgi:hypothetical protein